jgi:tetratricopeptide (TPR) repeat protein
MNRKERRAEKKLGKRSASGLSPAGEALFASAVQHHQAGRWGEAEGLYRRVLAINPRHADSLHLLGVGALQAGRPDQAVELIGAAIAIDADAALYHSNLGNGLKALGRLDEAIASYRRAIALQADYPEACNNLGAALLAQGRTQEAIACFRRAVDLKPDFPEAHDNLGAGLAEQGALEEAVACHRKAVALRLDYAEAHNNLGAALKALGALDEAAGCFRRAIALKPGFPQAHNNLAIVLKRQGRLEEAVACCRRAIDLDPGFPEAYDNLGAALADQGRLEEAVASLRKALDLRPDYPEARDDLGVTLKEQGLLDEAIACFRTAIDLNPAFPNAHNNLAMALLARGDLAEGWREYEWRWRTAGMAASRRHFAQPQWRGEAGRGRTLLIHAEQGFGDTLQFCRYAPLAAAAGLRVVLEAPPPLVRLLRGLSGADRVVARGEDLPAFDLHCPMLSLPLALGTTLATIPSAPSYLHADAGQAEVWRARLAAMGDRGPKIGLAWAGNPATTSDRRRSLAPDRLAALYDLSGLRFFSLQKGGPAAPRDAPLTDVMDEMHDFADTAALVANLDLVISVDTAVAHLAAALGRPVWLLDRFDPDWRWLVGRRDSPWYPTLRLYRQPRPGDWEPVLAEVARDLAGLAEP